LPDFCAAPGPSPITDPTLFARCSTEIAVRPGGKYATAALRDTANARSLVRSGNFGSVGLDGGDPAWQQHLAQMYAFIGVATPAEALVVDRADWAGLFNPARDDGVSWYNGSAVASMVVGNLAASAAVAAVLHERGAPMMLNNHAYRADLARDFDGIFDELCVRAY
jgi:hypothetical protein